MAKTKLTTRQKQSKKINRKRAVRKWWQTTSRRVIIISLAGGLVTAAAGGWWFWHSGKLSQVTASVGGYFWNDTAKLGFKLENVYLEGRHYTPMQDVKRALDITAGQPILAISLNDMRARLEAVPRVKYAEVARVLPNQLHVRIVEREPVAVWQNEGKLHLIDQDGVAMEYIDPAQYKQLMLVVGEDAPSHTRSLLDALALEPELAANVTCAIRVGERRWNIRFKNGVELKLPEKNEQAAWQNFARIDREQHIMERAVKTVDMRLNDRVFIKVTPQDAKPGKDTGSET
jgi:cell division protein FtsQ